MKGYRLKIALANTWNNSPLISPIASSWVARVCVMSSLAVILWVTASLNEAASSLNCLVSSSWAFRQARKTSVKENEIPRPVATK